MKNLILLFILLSICLTSISQTYQLTATVSPDGAYNKSVTWSSSNPAVATISSTGLVTWKSVGTAYITATTAEGGFSATSEVVCERSVTGITLDIYAITLAVGDGSNVYVTVLPADATDKSFSWSSSDTAVANIVGANAQGIGVRTYAAGTADITIRTNDGGYEAVCRFTVIVPVTGISINTVDTVFYPAQTRQFSATVIPADATSQNVTWSSSNPSVATVSSTGLVTGVSHGTAVITATSAYSSTIKASKTVTVKDNDATLKSISIPGYTFPYDRDTRIYTLVTVPYLSNSITVETYSPYTTVESDNPQYLPVGYSEPHFTVKSEYGNTLEYRFLIYRQNNDATLRAVNLIDATSFDDWRDIPFNIDPVSSVQNTVDVVNDVRKVNFNAQANDGNASIYADSYELDLQAGDNRFDITVTAEDPSFRKTYHFNIRRDEFRVNGVEATYWYYKFQNSSVRTITGSSSFEEQLPYTYFAVRTTLITNSIYTEHTGDLIDSTFLNYGINTFHQTADNGYDPPITCYFTYNRELNPNCQLQELNVTGHQIEPRYQLNTYNYKLNVDKYTASININAKAIDPAELSGDTGVQKLNHGNNLFTFKVTAMTGNTADYTLQVWRDTLETDASLAGLAVNPDAYLSPPFNPDITSYTTEVENAIDEIMIDANPRSQNAKFVDTYYNLPGTYPVKAGDNYFNFFIFAEDSYYFKIYSLKVTRKDNTTGMQDINSPFCRWLKPTGEIRINSPVAERVYIYSVTGTLLYSFDKPAGMAVMEGRVNPAPAPVLIVKGSSGWSRKIVVND